MNGLFLSLIHVFERSTQEEEEEEEEENNWRRFNIFLYLFGPQNPLYNPNTKKYTQWELNTRH